VLRRYLPPASLLLLAVLLWQGASAALRVPSWVLPSPGLILRTLYSDRALLADNAGVTLEETLVGFALALAAGIGLALLVHWSPVAQRALWPLLVASQTVPVPAIAPALVIWLGFGLAPKVVVVALVCFFPIVVATVDGLRGVDREWLDALRTLGANPRRLFAEVEWPAAMPSILSGVKIAITFSVIGAVLGEWVGATSGLGYTMIRASSQLLTARVFAAIAVLSAAAMLLFGATVLVERHILRWKLPTGGSDA
jgi:ABC-type nitrate/sulfonate/bicarbonate transport system permease component